MHSHAAAACADTHPAANAVDEYNGDNGAADIYCACDDRRQHCAISSLACCLKELRSVEPARGKECSVHDAHQHKHACALWYMQLASTESHTGYVHQQTETHMIALMPVNCWKIGMSTLMVSCGQYRRRRMVRYGFFTPSLILAASQMSSNCNHSACRQGKLEYVLVGLA
jgi:hypothetical protein